MSRLMPLFAAGLLLATGSPALADDSSNAAPVIVVDTAMLDPASVPTLGDDARKAITNDEAELKSSKLLALVFSASADGKTWASSTADKTNIISIQDLARASLETCQYSDGGVPCLILTINGHDARDAQGGWPVQPSMFERGAERFDASRVPFVWLSDRTAMDGYASATGPRALALTTGGSWTWQSGKTEFDAVAAVEASCKKLAPNDACLLYAVDDTVVFSSQ